MEQVLESKEIKSKGLNPEFKAENIMKRGRPRESEKVEHRNVMDSDE